MNLNGYRPVILWALVIFCLHIIPSDKIPNPPDWNFSVDKLVHFFLFAVLGFLLLRTYAEHRNKQSYGIFFVAIISIIFGLLMETIQIMVPGRDYNLVDLISDGAGAVFGCLVFVVVIRL